YLSNRSPTRSVKDQIPQEAWSGVKTKVDHLKVFGSIAYAHMPNRGRSKLDDRSAKQVFIGYDTNSKVRNLGRKCVRRRRDDTHPSAERIEQTTRERGASTTTKDLKSGEAVRWSSSFFAIIANQSSPSLTTRLNILAKHLG
ncbi:hypothetical protein CR513_29008, partial [Mucuna pruriens]